ncbi:MAG: phosphatase PAP2 family protein [Atopobiaceae bacterium]|nr:phosphatase PAP2 family protein [Atopobiaceae bacterium]
MDIDFLLWLQGVRQTAAPAIQAFFTFMGSEAAMAVAMVVPCLIYWCLDKACGQFALLAYGSSTVFNQLVKNTVCAYRPWVRDTRIVPDPAALAGAGGYSFPSGHTQSSASMLGAVALRWRERRWVAVVCALFTLLIGFSRNFLGVHTPQDVVVGLIEGCVFVALTNRVLPWIEAKEGHDAQATVAGVLATVLFLVFVTVKPYPLDYADGQPLVNPADMIDSCYKAAGAFLGILLGWFIERRYVRFQAGGLTVAEGIARLVVGGLLTLCVYKLVGGAAVALGGAYAGELVKHVVAFFTAVAAAPALFGRLHGLFSHEAR